MTLSGASGTGGTRAVRPRPLDNALLASAQRLTRETMRARPGQVGKMGAWQDDAWDMFDLVGELRFLAVTLAQRMSQARLYIGKLSDDPTEDPVPVDDARMNEVLDSVAQSSAARAQLLQRLGTNLFVPGEGWLVGIPRHMLPRSMLVNAGLTVPDVPPSPPEPLVPGTIRIDELEWRMLSISEVSQSTGGGDVQITLGPSPDEILRVNPDEVLLLRIWRPHPRRWWEADSPARSSLPVLRELVGLQMRSSAEIDSRLAGAGVLIIPQSAQRAFKNAAGLPEDSQEDPFTEALMEAMMTSIADRASASAVVPIVISVPDESADKFTHLTFSEPLDETAGERLDKAIRRLALGLDAPPELLLGTGCADTETEILTRSGWQTLETLDPDDEVYTLDHATGLAEWQRPSAINRFEVTDHPMLSMSGDSHSSLTTLDHRWPVIKKHPRTAGDPRRWTTSEQGFAQHDVVPLAAPLKVAQAPAEAKYADDFVRLLVAFTSDGSWQRHGGARIVKFCDGETVEMRRILTGLFGPDGFREERHPTATAIGTSFVLRQAEAATLHEHCDEVKAIHREFIEELTHSQLLILLDSCVQIGDGVMAGKAATLLYQVEPSRLEAFELAAVLTGHKVTYGVRETSGGFGIRPLHWVRWSRARTVFAPVDTSQTLVRYTGTVWCPTTGNGTWLMRRNGQVAFTGNSMNHWGAWLVLEDVVTTHLEPPLALICDALTTQYFWPVVTGEGFGMAPEQAHQYVIWYDVSDLVVRPNRSTDAMGLFDKGALSQVALRRATGFDETDAPETIPQEAQIAIDAIKQAPSLLATVNLADLVAQIRAVLTGQPAPASSSPPAPAGTSPAGGAQPAQGQPSGGPPDVPTDQPQKGTGSVPAPESIAASGSGPRPAPETAPMGLPFGALGAVSMPDWMMNDTEKIPLPDLSRAAELGGRGRGTRARRRRD